MGRIETQVHPDADDYAQSFPDDDVIESPKYRVVDTVQHKPAKLTKLETLETKARTLRDSLVSNWVDLADTISAIIDTDLWKQSGYKTVRDYCKEQLGWSYEYCRKIINGAVAVQQTAQLTEAPSNAVAAELGRIPEAERAEAIKTITANDQSLTADRVKIYREISESGAPATPEEIIRYTDQHIEQRVLTEAKKHSKPAEMLKRLAEKLEG